VKNPKNKEKKKQDKVQPQIFFIDVGAAPWTDATISRLQHIQRWNPLLGATAHPHHGGVMLPFGGPLTPTRSVRSCSAANSEVGSVGNTPVHHATGSSSLHHHHSGGAADRPCSAQSGRLGKVALLDNVLLRAATAAAGAVADDAVRYHEAESQPKALFFFLFFRVIRLYFFQLICEASTTW
jgi:hypothetical protein